MASSTTRRTPGRSGTTPEPMSSWARRGAESHLVCGSARGDVPGRGRARAAPERAPSCGHAARGQARAASDRRADPSSGSRLSETRSLPASRSYGSLQGAAREEGSSSLLRGSPPDALAAAVEAVQVGGHAFLAAANLAHAAVLLHSPLKVEAPLFKHPGGRAGRRRRQRGPAVKRGNGSGVRDGSAPLSDLIVDVAKLRLIRPILLSRKHHLLKETRCPSRSVSASTPGTGKERGDIVTPALPCHRVLCTACVASRAITLSPIAARRHSRRESPAQRELPSCAAKSAAGRRG